jgi:hypothetical protein
MMATIGSTNGAYLARYVEGHLFWCCIAPCGGGAVSHHVEVVLMLSWAKYSGHGLTYMWGCVSIEVAVVLDWANLCLSTSLQLCGKQHAHHAHSGHRLLEGCTWRHVVFESLRCADVVLHWVSTGCDEGTERRRGYDGPARRYTGKGTAVNSVDPGWHFVSAE